MKSEATDAVKITRRALLKAASTATVTLSLGRLAPLGDASANAWITSGTGKSRQDSGSGADHGKHDKGANGALNGVDEASTLVYRNYLEVYREKWTWDRVARGTHYVNCAYQRGCAWNVYVKDGIVWREEQLGEYPQTNRDVPDYNPRGCQKGACYSARMYDPTRLTYPLKRVGKRGKGRWKRVTWDEALSAIAESSIDVLSSDGPGAIYWDMGSAMSNGCHGLGLTRTVNVLDTPMFEANTEIGDHFPGASVTLGKICYTSSYDDFMYSDLILIWGGNPVNTQIPNAHFVNEARYNGARVVAIAPDYNPSSIHADEWIAVTPGSDAAFGLSLAHVMVSEGIYDARFVKEQSDLPLLVRADNGLFLREKDMKAGGAEDVFYVYDTGRGGLRVAPKRSLALEELDPALEGSFEVETRQGRAEVTTVFELLRKRLEDYSPEKAQAISGANPGQVRRLARALAGAQAASSLAQTNFCKYYHGLEMERAQILVFTLAGQIGKKGAGIAAFPYMSIAGPDGLSVSSGRLSPKLGLLALGAKSAPEFLRLKWEGYSNQMILFEMTRQEYRHGRYIATPLFLYMHGGLRDLYGSAKSVDGSMKREFHDYFDEAVEKGWQVVPKTPPRILFEVGGNMLRRVRGYDRLYKVLLPKLDLLVTLDWRMSNTARYSDYVLPAAGWYEKDDITWGSPITPYCHVTTRAVEPLGESKSDWQFHCLYMKALQERAVQRGIREYRDRAGRTRRLDRVYDEFSFGRRYTENNTEEFLEEILAVTSNLDKVGWKQIKAKGFARYTGVGMAASQIAHATDFETGETITANTWHTVKKEPWPTLTRRIQFYIDHPLYFELGEELPVHKDNPPMGGDYPLQMVGAHARHSIHASWRDEKHLLNLQRGEPLIYLSTQDADARGIRDGETVRVFNDIGSFKVHAKVAPAIRPGQLLIYHAWEPFQFKKGKSHQSLIPSPMNPIHLAGGYFQLQPTLLQGEPGSPDRGTRVDVERIA